MKRRSLLLAVAGAGLTAPAGVPLAQTAAWPNRPIRIVVPFPPGTANDIAARVLSQFFAPHFDQPFVVENVTGAGGSIGVTTAAQSRNAHTLLLASTAMTIAPHFGAVRYDVARDFDAIGTISVFPGVLVVPAASRYQSMAEIVADAKAAPGQVVCGTGGSATSSHLAAELFMGLAGISFNLVPYRGEGALVPDIVSGNIPLAVVNLPSALRFIRGGQLRALAVAARERHADLPGIATFGELGLVGMEALGWVVLLAAKGIPEEGLSKLEALLEQALAAPSVASTLVGAGISPVPGRRRQADAFIAAEGEHWGRLIRARGIKAQP